MRKVILFLSFLLCALLCACHTQPSHSYEDGLSDGYADGYYVGYDEGVSDGFEEGKYWGYEDGLDQASGRISYIAEELFSDIDRSINKKYDMYPDQAVNILDDYLHGGEYSEEKVFSALYAIEEYICGVYDAKHSLMNLDSSDLE